MPKEKEHMVKNVVDHLRAKKNHLEKKQLQRELEGQVGINDASFR